MNFSHFSVGCVFLGLLCVFDIVVTIKMAPEAALPGRPSRYTLRPPQYTYGTDTPFTGPTPKPSCKNQTYPRVVLDKSETYTYLYGEYGRRIPFRALFQKMKNGWHDTVTFPKVQFTERQRSWLKTLDKEVITRAKRQITPACTRKEYRLLSTTERNTLHNAYDAMLSHFPDPNDNDNEYHIFVKLHRYANAPAAHGGPAFLPWHRHFLFLFEQALRQHEPTVCLPYWDSTLDQTLPVPSDSAIWTNSYLGNNNGFVTTGFAANWPVLSTCGQAGGSTLYRNAMTGSSGQFALFSDPDIQWVLDQNSFDAITCPNNCKFEWDHGFVHVFVGGQMSSLSCSPSDPVFWMHHAFVDCTWQRFRELSPYPGPASPNLDYGTTSQSGHGAVDPMLPWNNLVNAQGLSDHYTNYYYKCAPPPSSCDPNARNPCGSSILWCDPETCICKAKVRQGGVCTGLKDQACAGPCGHLKFMYPYCNKVTNTCQCRFRWIGPVRELPQSRHFLTERRRILIPLAASF